MVHFNNDWDEVLAGEFDQEYYKRIRYFLKQEYAEQTVYPPMEYIFNALRLTPYSSVKAVILGHGPYHGPVRRTVCAFPFSRASRFRPAFRTSTRSSRATSASSRQRTARSPNGRSRAF